MKKYVSLNGLVPNTWLSLSLDQHNYKTSSPTQGNLMKGAMA